MFFFGFFFIVLFCFETPARDHHFTRVKPSLHCDPQGSIGSGPQVSNLNLQFLHSSLSLLSPGLLALSQTHLACYHLTAFTQAAPSTPLECASPRYLSS